MSYEPSLSVKLMIQSGLIPENSLQQLVNWRLLPEDSVQLSGSRPINIEEDGEDVLEFVEELRGALDSEAKTIRETELDQVGEYKKACLAFSDDSIAPEDLDVFIDKLGRAILPSYSRYQKIRSIQFMGDGNSGQSGEKKVLSAEPRYKGQKVVAYVAYLEAE